MQRFLKFNSFLLVLGLLLISCDTTNSPYSDLSNDSTIKDGSLANLLDDTYELNDGTIKGAQVTVDRDLDDSFTTFTFTVKNVITTGSNTTLTGFKLALPSCLPEPTFIPDADNGGIFDEDEFTITWGTTIPAPPSNNERTYTITYEGDIPAGTIDANITRQGDTGQVFSGSVAGPACVQEQNVTVSGTLFIDMIITDGELHPGEAGLENIEVKLLQNGNTFATTTTSEWGGYSFDVPVSSGNYTLEVPETLVDFVYYEIFDYTPSTERPTPNTYLIGTDSGDVLEINFGYVLNTEQMTQDLLSGVVETNTKPWQYWALQLRNPANNERLIGRNPNINFTKNDLVEILDEIEGFYLEDPFQFGNIGDTNRLKAALDILHMRGPLDTDLKELLRELLTAQLNVLSKQRGALIEYNENGDPILNDPFNTAIMIYGEQEACKALVGPENCIFTPQSSSFAPKVNALRINGVNTTGTISYSLSGTSTLSAFNGTGGIGSR
jgi:hypothetical protein